MPAHITNTTRTGILVHRRQSSRLGDSGPGGLFGMAEIPTGVSHRRTLAPVGQIVGKIWGMFVMALLRDVGVDHVRYLQEYTEHR